MKQKQYILPVQCVGCGATFDLWHDLLSKDGNLDNLDAEGLGEQEHFCWRCRRLLREEDQETEADGLELELSWY